MQSVDDKGVGYERVAMVAYSLSLDSQSVFQAHFHQEKYLCPVKEAKGLVVMHLYNEFWYAYFILCLWETSTILVHYIFS